MDDKGKTTTLTKEQVVRGKRLFIAACASCHVGGGTRTNQNVGLAIEELSGAQPNRATVEGLVDYLNNPTTYDGLKDLLTRCHCSRTVLTLIKAATYCPLGACNIMNYETFWNQVLLSRARNGLFKPSISIQHIQQQFVIWMLETYGTARQKVTRHSSLFALSLHLSTSPIVVGFWTCSGIILGMICRTSLRSTHPSRVATFGQR